MMPLRLARPQSQSQDKVSILRDRLHRLGECRVPQDYIQIF